MYGLGIDVLEPDRLRHRVERRPALLDELFLPSEILYCDGQHAPYLHFAARYCAKEAVIKALGLEAFDPLEIEVVPGSAAPEVRLSGAADRRAKDLGVRLIVSMTHVASIASAVAIAVPASG